MADYYFSAQGNRGAVSRLSSHRTGGEVEARSWYDGMRIWLRRNKELERNEYTLDFTGGSSHAFSKRLGIFYLKKNQDGKRFVVFEPNERSLNGKDDILFEL